jgi:cobalt-zinc-cadmium efflux system membrane fusion protein
MAIDGRSNDGTAPMSRRLTTAGIVAAVAWLFLSCGQSGTEAPPPRAVTEETTPVADPHSIQPPPAVRDRVRVQAAALRAVPETVTAPGEVALDLKQVAKITSRIEGQVEQIHVQLGDRVKQRQPLAAIGSLQLDQLIEEYLVDKAQADVAENGFRRTEKLRAEDIVTERKLIEDKGRYLETQARYQHIREKLLNMGLSTTELLELERGHHEQAHRYTLTAPISGTVVMQNAVRGQGVKPGDELFEIVDTSRVWVFANLPIELARKFKEGDSGTITPKGGDPITAALTYIAPVADQITRTVRVRFEVVNLRGHLKPQEYVEVALSWSGPLAVTVPLSALTTVDKVRGIFLQRAAGYTFLPIESGREGGGMVEITHGVHEGDLVAVEGVFDLKNVLLKEQIGSGE